MSITSLNSSHSGKACMQLQKSLKLNTEAWLHMSTGESKLHAYDDSVAFALGNEMKSRLITLNVVSDGITQSQEMLNIAEGSMRKLIDLSDTLNTIIARAKQGLVDNNTIKTALAPAFNLTKQEMIRIVEETEFNGVKLLNGTGGKRNLGKPSVVTVDYNGTAAIAAAITKDNYTFGSNPIIEVKGLPTSFEFKSGTVHNSNVNMASVIDVSTAAVTLVKGDTPIYTNNNKVQIQNATVDITGAFIKDADHPNIDANSKITIENVTLEGDFDTASPNGSTISLKNFGIKQNLSASNIKVTTLDSQITKVDKVTLTSGVEFGHTTVSIASSEESFMFGPLTAVTGAVAPAITMSTATTRGNLTGGSASTITSVIVNGTPTIDLSYNETITAPGLSATIPQKATIVYTPDPNNPTGGTVTITNAKVTLPNTKVSDSTNNNSVTSNVEMLHATLEGTVANVVNGKINLSGLKITHASLPKSSGTPTNVGTATGYENLDFGLPIQGQPVKTSQIIDLGGTASISNVSTGKKYIFDTNFMLDIDKPSTLTAGSGVLTTSNIPINTITNKNSSITITSPGNIYYQGANGSRDKFTTTNTSIRIHNAQITDSLGNNEDTDILLENVILSGDISNIDEAGGIMNVKNINVAAAGNDVITSIHSLGNQFVSVNGLKLDNFTLDTGVISKPIPTAESLSTAAAASTVGRPVYDFTNASMIMNGGQLDVTTKAMSVDATNATGVKKTSNINKISYNADQIKVDSVGIPRQDNTTGDVTFTGATITISGAQITDDGTSPDIATATADITVHNVTITGTPNPMTTNDKSSISLTNPTITFPGPNTATATDNYAVKITSPTTGANLITKIDMTAASKFKLDTFNTPPTILIENVKTSHPLSGGVGATSTFTFVTGADLLNSTIDVTLPNLRLDSRNFTAEDGSIIKIPGVIATLNTPYNILDQKLDNLPDLQSQDDATNSIALVNALKDILITEINALGAQQQRFINISDQLSTYTEGIGIATGVFLDADLPKEAEIAAKSKAAIDIIISALQNLNSLAGTIARIVTG